MFFQDGFSYGGDYGGDTGDSYGDGYGGGGGGGAESCSDVSVGGYGCDGDGGETDDGVKGSLLVHDELFMRCVVFY